MKKVLFMSAAAVVGFVGFGAVTASAQTQPATYGNHGQGRGQGQGNGRQSSLEMRAAVFGMSVDELQKALETKTMSQIAVEKGMSEADFRAKMNAAAEARWKERGLSADEIAKRVADRNARHEQNRAGHEFGSGDGNHQGGYGRNR
jgi:hypothetical protein